MAAIGLKEILALAEKRQCAIPAFNVYNMETVMGVAAAAEESRSPVIFQVYSRLFDNAEGEYVAEIIKKAIEKLTVPAAFHLDHGAGQKEVLRALRCGASGIMVDASALPFEKNVAQTRAVVTLCGYAGVAVEGELGHIGSVNDTSMGVFTDPAEAAQYAVETGIAALAVLVGTAHGRYKQTPKLDIDRIAAIKAATELPLVLHGGSGIPDAQLQAAIQAGIRKINFGTDVCYAFLDSVFAVSRDKIAVDLFMKEPIAAVKAFALEKIRLLGAPRALEG